MTALGPIAKFRLHDLKTGASRGCVETAALKGRARSVGPADSVPTGILGRLYKTRVGSYDFISAIRVLAPRILIARLRL